MKMNRTPFLRTARKNKQRAANKPRRASALAGSIAMLVGSIAALLTAPSAHATPYNWTGLTTGFWNLNTNWSGGVVPLITDDLTILGPSNVAGALTIDFDADNSARSLNFTNTAATSVTNTTSGANRTLTLGSGGITTGTGAVQIGTNALNQAVNITLGAAQTWNVGAGGLTVTNFIGGLGTGITKTGTGNLLFNTGASNGFTGGLNVNGGTVTLDFVNLGTPTNLIAATNALQINSGTLTITGRNVAAATTAQTFAGTTLGAGRNTINIAKGASATSATLTLGILTANTGSATTFSPTTAWTTTTSTTERVFITAGGSVPALPGAGTTAFVEASVFHRVAGGAVGSLRLAAVNEFGQLLLKANAGNLAVATGVDPTGSYQLSAGSIALTNTGASIYGLLLNATGAGTNITVANSGTLTLNSVIQIKATESVAIIPGTGVSNVVIGAERNLVIAMDNAAAFSITAPIVNNGGGASAVTIVGTAPTGTPGTVSLNAANTFSGQLSVVNNQLNINTINNESATGPLGNSALSVILGAANGVTGTLGYTGATGTSTKKFTLATGGTGAFTLASPNVLTLNGEINGGGNLSKTGTGTLTLGGANIYTGATTISGGTLSLANTGALANTDISVSNAGSTFAVTPLAAGTVNLGNSLTAGAGATLNLGSGTVFSMVNGAAGGTTNLVQGATFATNALTLNTATLNFELSGATADNLAVTGALATASVTGTNTINLTPLAALTAGTYNLITTANATGGLSTGGTFVFGGSGTTTQTVALGTNAYLLTLNNAANVESVTVGAPTVITGVTWTGRTNGLTVANASWDNGISTNWATGSTATAFGNGTAVTFGDTNAVGGTAPTGTVTIAAGGVTPTSTTFDNTAVNYTVGGGGIGGTGGITKSGTGSLTLSGANTYSGTTTITEGTLSVNNVVVAASASGLGNATSAVILGSASTKGTLLYTGGAAIYTRNFTIGAGGGEVDSTAANLTLLPGVTPIYAPIAMTGPLTLGTGTTAGTTYITIGSATMTGPMFTGTGALTINGNAGGVGTVVLTSLSDSVVTTAAMPINIAAGNLTYQNAGTGAVNANILGTGTITLTPAASNGGSLFLSVAGVTNTLANPIAIADAAGTATISNSGGITFSNAVTGPAGANTPTLLLQNTNGANFALTFTGGVTGKLNLQLQGTNNSANNPITLSGTAVNNTGTISNITATGSSAMTISAAVGSNVTGLTQAGISAFNISGGVTVNAAGLPITSTNTGAFTLSGAISGTTGTPNLTIQANSTGNITLNGSSVNNTGTITNSGSGTNLVTISAPIGSSVTDVVQNSASSDLLLSGTNAYTGTATITSGLMQFSQSGAIAGFTGTPNANVRISVANGGILGFAYPAVTGTDITTLVNNANGGTYSNVTFAATGASIGLDTAGGSTSFPNVLANPTGSALGLVKLGANTLTLGNANTYTGATAVRNGTLSVSSVGNVAVPVASSLGMPVNATNGTISLGFRTTAGALTYTGAGETSDRNIALAGTTGGGTIDNAGAGTLTLGGVTSTGVGAKTLTISGASNTTFGAAVAGGGVGSASPLTITKTGAGTLLLNATGPINTNTVTLLNIAGGIVDIGASGLTISNSGATVIDSTVNTTINATGGGTLTISSNTGTNAGDIRPAANTTLTINANIATPVTNTGFWTAQGGGLELNNTGTLVLNGNNTIAGVTSMTAAGTISVGNIATNLGGTTGLLFGVAGSRFLYTGTGETTAVPIQTGAIATAIVEQAGPSGTLNFSANWATGAAVQTVTLQGSTAGLGVMSGIISNNSGTNTTAITKAGTGTWTLSGPNTYTGATTVNNGNLRLTTGTTNNSAVTVNNGGTLSIVGNYTIGNAGTAAAGGRLTLAAGGTLDLADGVINDLTLTQNATFATAGAAFNGGTIRLDVSGTDADSIINSGGTVGSTSSGSNYIIINPIAGFAAGGAYTIISGGAGTGTIGVGSNIFLATSTVSFGGSPFTLALTQSGKDAQLTITAGAGGAPGLAYWNGTTNSSWAHQPGGAGTATNWVAAASGGPDTLSLPGGGATGTNVIVSSNVVGTGGLSTTLDAAFDINSLNFTGTGTSNTTGATIAAGTGGTLTLNAAAVNGNVAGNGMTIAAGSGANTISAPITLGANQTWTNNATTVTTVSGVISEASAGRTLTKAGTGPMTFSGSASNTYTGLTTVVNAGNVVGTAGLTLAKTGGAIAIAGNLTIGSATTNQFGIVYLGGNEQISPTATITFTGSNSGWGFLEMQGRTQTIGNVVETTPGFGVIETTATATVFGASNVIFNVASGTQTYQGYFRDIATGLGASNSLKLTKTGTGILQWGAAAGTGAAGSGAAGHAYSGGTDIQNGTLQLLAANTASAISIVGAGNVSLNGGALVAGTLDLNGLNAGITGLDGTTGAVLGQVVNNVSATTAILSIGNNANNGSFAGLLLNNNNAGTGILAVTKVGAGTQVLSGANTYTGNTTLTAGTLNLGVAENVNVSGPLGKQLANAAGTIIMGGGTLQYSASNNFDYSGRFSTAASQAYNIDTNGQDVTWGTSLISSAGTLSKTGLGRLTVTGTNTYTGTTTVDGGTLRLNGNTTTTAGTYRVGNAASSNGMLVIETGSSLTTTAGSSLLVGVGANSVGVVTQNGGAFAINSTNANNNFVIGSGVGAVANTATANGSFGAYNLNGGTVVGSQIEIGNGGGVGMLNITDGTLSPTGPAGQKFVIISRFGSSTGVVTVAGSGLQNPTLVGGANSAGIALGWTDGGSNSRAELNIGNRGVVSGGAAASGIDFRSAAAGTGNVGIVNLLTGGTLNAGILRINTGTPTAIVNLNGGTLKATQSTATFMQGLTSAYVQSAGALIDTDIFNITIGQPLLAPTNSGVSSLTISGSGYEAAPYVSITGDGVGATAIATIDGTGNITGFTITNPGVNYTTATVSLVGGGGTGTASAAFAANTSGGLTKTGLGTLTLSGANTFSGVVNITGGTLMVPTINNGGSASGTLGASSNAASNLLLNSTTAGGGILGYNGTVAGTTDRNFTLNNVSGGFEASGTTLGTFTLTAANAMTVAPGLGAAALTLQGTGAGATGLGSIGTLIADGTGTTVGVTKAGSGTWAITNAANSYTGPTTITAGTLSVAKLDAGGNNSSIGASTNAAANLVLQGGTLQYTGTGDTTDRNYTFGNATTATGGTIDSVGAGPLVITGNMTGVNVTAGTQALTLSSLTTSGANRMDGIISDSSGTALTGVTKTGVGAWTLAGANTYSGATTISAGTLQFAGTSSLNSVTQIGMANGATLQVRDDTAGTINHTTNSITASGSGTVTIDVGNNGGANTGSTVAFGALNNGTPANALSTTFNFTGANGYLQSYSSLGLTGLTGGNTTLVPTTTSVTITGNVTNQESGSVTAHFDTLTLGGTSTGNAINGIISNNAGFVSVGNGDTRVTKSSSSTWTLGGANTYTGPTVVNGGTLILNNAAASLANTAIAVNPAASGASPTLVLTPGAGTINIGNNATTLLGATLTLNPGTAANPMTSAFTMQDNAVGIVNLVQGATFAGNALTLGGATAVGYVRPSMSFDIGGTILTDIDVFNVTKLATVGTGGVLFNFAALTGSTSLTVGNYTFLTAGAGSTLSVGGGLYSLGTSTLSVGPTTYALSLANSTATAGILTISALAGNASAFWEGDINGSWNSPTPGTDTNFATSLDGSTDILALPDLNSNVTFTTTVASNLSTTLDAAFTINSLTFNGTGTSNAAGSTIATGTGSNTLTINALAVNGNPLGNGITVGTGSGPNTISAAVALGASQSWTVASGTSLAVSGDVSGTGFALTLPGNGTVTLSGNNTYDGGTNLNSGTLNINSATAIGTGPLTVVNATINSTAVFASQLLTTNNAQTWVNNGALAFTGTQSLNLGNGAVTLGDAAAANFTLSNNAAPATSVLTVGGAITGGAGGTPGAKTLTVAGTGDIVLSGNITRGATATSLDLTVTNTGNVNLAGTSTVRTLNANGGPTSVINLTAGSLTLSNAGAQTINSTGGTINGPGTIALSGTTASPGDNGVATGATLTINAQLTGTTTDFEYFSATQLGTFVFTNVNNNFANLQFSVNGAVSVPSLGNSGSDGPAGRGAISFAGGGTLIYTGTGETSNKSINQNGTTAGATLDQSGPSGNLLLTTFGTPGVGIKTLTLQGSTAGTGEISAVIANNSGTNTTAVTKTGTGTWTLSGPNTYTGMTTVNAGTLKIGSSTTLTSGNPVTLAGTGTFDLNGFSVSIGALTSSVATSTITNSSANVTASTATAPGTPSGAGVFVDALTISGAGPTVNALITDGATRKTQVVLNNNNNGTSFGVIPNGTLNTFSGGLVLAHNGGSGTRLTINATPTGTPFGTGPIIVGQAATDRAHIFIGGSNVTLNSPVVSNTTLGADRVGTFRVDGTNTILSGTLTANLAPMAISTNGTGAVNITGKITGPLGFQLLGNSASTAGSLTVTLTNTGTANDYQGDTVVNFNPFTRPFTLRLGAANQIPNGSSTGNVTLNTNAAGIATFDLNTFSETINGLTGNAGSIVDTIAGGTPTLTLGDNNATGNNFSGIIRNTAGTLAVTKIGTGTQTLSGANTYTGATAVNQGILVIGAGGTIATASTITVDNTATLRFDRIDTWGNHTTLTTSPIVVNAGGTVASNGVFNTLVNPTLNGGTMTLNGGASSNFPAFAIKGTLTVGGTVASNINVGTGTFNLINIGTSGTPGTLIVDVADATLSTATDLTVNAVLQNNKDNSNVPIASALTKTGVGTMTLTNSNTYTGATTVDAGTLAVTGSLSGTTAVVVNNGGTLLLNSSTDANNIVGGTPATYTGTNGSTLKAGNTVTGGVTNTFSSLTLSGTSTLDFGGSNDGNTFVFNTTSNSLIGVSLNIWNWNSNGNFYAPASTDGGAIGDGQSRLLFTSTGTFAAGDLANIKFYSDNGSTQIGFGDAAQIGFGGQFEIVPVPEPATTALIGAVALCALIGYRERRRFSRKSGSNSAA